MTGRDSRLGIHCLGVLSVLDVIVAADFFTLARVSVRIQ